MFATGRGAISFSILPTIAVGGESFLCLALSKDVIFVYVIVEALLAEVRSSIFLFFTGLAGKD